MGRPCCGGCVEPNENSETLLHIGIAIGDENNGDPMTAYEEAKGRETETQKIEGKLIVLEPNSNMGQGSMPRGSVQKDTLNQQTVRNLVLDAVSECEDRSGLRVGTYRKDVILCLDASGSTSAGQWRQWFDTENWECTTDDGCNSDVETIKDILGWEESKSTARRCSQVCGSWKVMFEYDVNERFEQLVSDPFNPADE
tara:strand:- start:367 stop:960 length:594 start_codon:yes stop_codon:yes gene_type:complete